METTETYRGIEIEISNDTYAEDPWENWDGCVPLITDGGRQFISREDSDIIDYLRNYLSYNQVKRHQTRVMKMMGYSLENIENERKWAKNDGYDLSQEILDDYLYSWLDDGIENLETFCTEFNIKHLSSPSRGYSQGDHIDCFFLWTPEFEKITGRSYESMTEETFNYALELFTAYAWGGCLSF